MACVFLVTQENAGQVPCISPDGRKRHCIGNPLAIRLLRRSRGEEMGLNVYMIVDNIQRHDDDQQHCEV
jgi:hypothetical protein